MNLDQIRAGRKCKQLPSPVAVALNNMLNGGLDVHRIGRCCPNQYFFQLTCGRHFKWISVKGVVDNLCTLSCKYCSKDGKPSSWELEAFTCLTDLGLAPVVIESKVLKGKYGAADFYLPTFNLIIQIDGEGHIGEGHHSSNPSEQVERDQRFNAAAVASGFNLFRVAHDDMHAFQPLLLQVLTGIQSNGQPVWHLSPGCLEAQGPIPSQPAANHHPLPPLLHTPTPR